MAQHATRMVSSLPKGTSVGRLIRAMVAGDGSVTLARDIALTMRETPLVGAAFDLLLKAATPPGTSTNPSWGGALVESGIAEEAIDLLRGLSIMAAVQPRARLVPFNMVVPRDTSAVALGGWAGEAGPIPATNLAFDGLGPLPLNKLGAIIPFTKELILAGTPTTEAIVGNTVLRGLAATNDRDFLLPTSGATAAHPASITNGATEVVSTGSTAAEIQADLSALIAAIGTAGTGLTWIMRPKTAATVAKALGLTNELPARLYTFPAIVSANSPQQITLVDASAILIADDGQFEVAVSETATPQFNTTPDAPATAATVFISLYQNNLVGIRAIRWLSWLRATPDAVAFMTTSY